MYIYIYICVCALPAPRHASIVIERNKVIKERNKVITASVYYLEQRHARLIVDGISIKTDKTVKESRGRARVKES